MYQSSDNDTINDATSEYLAPHIHNALVFTLNGKGNPSLTFTMFPFCQNDNSAALAINPSFLCGPYTK
jgi:hypothetical protein